MAKLAVGLSGAAMMAELPTNPANLSQAFPEDVRFWIDNIDKLTERWNKWSAQK